MIPLFWPDPSRWTAPLILVIVAKESNFISLFCCKGFPESKNAERASLAAEVSSGIVFSTKKVKIPFHLEGSRGKAGGGGEGGGPCGEWTEIWRK